MIPPRGKHPLSSSAMGCSVGSSRVSGIDGLRGVTACVVALGSSVLLLSVDAASRPQLVELGEALRHAVLLLVVLSGHVLYRPFAAAVLLRQNRPYVPAFVVGRALRLVPAYVVVLVCSAYTLGTPLLGPVGPTDATDLPVAPGHLTGRELSAALAALAGLQLLVGPLWRLGRGHLRSQRGRTWAAWCMAAPPLALLLTGVAGRALLAWPQVRGAAPDQVADVATAFIGVAGLVALGMLSAVVAVLLERRPLGPRTRQVVRRWVVAAGAGSCAVGLALLGRGDALPWGAAGACAIALLTAPGRSAMTRGMAALLDLRPIAHLGRISYGIWLWSVPAVFWMQQHLAGAGGVREVLAALGLILVLAEATYWLVERPVARLPRPAPPAPEPRRHALPAFLPAPDLLTPPAPAAAQHPAPIGCFPLAVPQPRPAPTAPALRS